MTHTPAPPFALTSGPRDARIALVGEALGEQEQLVGRPFVGKAGQELTQLLREVGIDRDECFLTNVIAMRPTPTSNNFDVLCGTRAEVGKDYHLPMLRQGKYLRPEYFGELTRLYFELSQVNPNVVIALGGTASWALLHNGAISRIRGTIAISPNLPSTKILPTFHPSYLFQVYKDRPIVLCDLAKAKRESVSPHFARPERQVLVSPSLEEIREWVSVTLHHSTRPPLIACDIETTGGQIESIAFARSRAQAITIPFIVRSPLRSYWPTAWGERTAREQVQRLLASDIPKVGQNFIYDMQYLLREGFTLRAIAHDTMLLHHSMYPELQKSLGFLGSCYTNEPAWKLMRKRKKEEELKRDD